MCVTFRFQCGSLSVLFSEEEIVTYAPVTQPKPTTVPTEGRPPSIPQCKLHIDLTPALVIQLWKAKLRACDQETHASPPDGGTGDSVIVARTSNWHCNSP